MHRLQFRGNLVRYILWRDGGWQPLVEDVFNCLGCDKSGLKAFDFDGPCFSTQDLKTLEACFLTDQESDIAKAFFDWHTKIAVPELSGGTADKQQTDKSTAFFQENEKGTLGPVLVVLFNNHKIRYFLKDGSYQPLAIDVFDAIGWRGKSRADFTKSLLGIQDEEEFDLKNLKTFTFSVDELIFLRSKVQDESIEVQDVLEEFILWNKKKTSLSCGHPSNRRPPPRGLLNDKQITELAEQGMIQPFCPELINQDSGIENSLFDAPDDRRKVISHGLSSYGYDIRLSPKDFQIFQHIPGTMIDPKRFNPQNLRPVKLHAEGEEQFFILPAHSYGLGVALERIEVPDNISVICIGKSTYARSAIIANLTPAEAGWKGNLTLELSNASPADCKVYANEGIVQLLFFEGQACDVSYGDRNGKYQGQSEEVTLARV